VAPATIHVPDASNFNEHSVFGAGVAEARLCFTDMQQTACWTRAPAQQLKFSFCYSITWGQQLPGLLLGPNWLLPASSIF
jgi:hypothetical protein